MSDSQTPENENVRIVKSAIEAYNAHDVNRAIEHEAESIVQYAPGRPGGEPGQENSRLSMIADFTSFPDLRFETERILGQGEWVAVQGILTGINTGPIRTGKRRMAKGLNRRLSVPLARLHRLQNGKIVETHSYWDRRRVDAQLGLFRRNVVRTMLVTAVGIVFMFAQATVLANPDIFWQLLGMAFASFAAILGSFSLGISLLQLSKVE